MDLHVAASGRVIWPLVYVHTNALGCTVNCASDLMTVRLYTVILQAKQK